ncbi:metallophosphoesterase family protein [Dyadobacter psychrotolerans]|uniref:Transcriptional regulator n=1 Tax=Dyadobacter psychrotolerans TaxID=2541721 RepID=A0A4R5DCK4_9BACT|nr:metallophosphoesterase [Dyadobacter psychrotolerans]TDE09551.1 transcriptional regulator [Dyadobacter psychrotolerans]
MFTRRSFLWKFIGLSGFLLSCKDKDIEKPAESKDDLSLRFIVCSDGHFGQPGTDYIADHQNIVRWINQKHVGEPLDFVVFNGDIIHDKAEFLAQVKGIFDNLSMPYFVTRGNHDMVSADTWKETWGYFPNHSFEKSAYGFILGDTSNEKGEIVNVDIKWLAEQLAKYKEKQKIFIFLHVPQIDLNASPVVVSEAMQMIESHSNIGAVFHGHDHNMDTLISNNGKHYIFDGHFGGNWGLSYKGFRTVNIDESNKLVTSQYDPGKSVIVNENLL